MHLSHVHWLDKFSDVASEQLINYSSADWFNVAGVGDGGRIARFYNSVEAARSVVRMSSRPIHMWMLLGVSGIFSTLCMEGGIVTVLMNGIDEDEV